MIEKVKKKVMEERIVLGKTNPYISFNLHLAANSGVSFILVEILGVGQYGESHRLNVY